MIQLVQKCTAALSLRQIACEKSVTCRFEVIFAAYCMPIAVCITLRCDNEDAMKRPISITATDKVYAHVRDQILAGVYGAATRLGEAALAEELGISRTPVREALRKLSSDGYVDLRPHVGAVVKPWNPEEVQSSFLIRADIESQAAARAAERIALADLAALEDICERIEAATDTSGEAMRSALNRELHARILEISGLSHAEKIVTQLMDLAVLTFTFGSFTAEEVARSNSDHRLLMRAFRARDAQLAQSVMRTHILTAAVVHDERRAGLRR
ncbi:MAG: GntR family transcriptional regulator [Paracoccus sp. (in: a-proteobacteria)]|uniref:GntR family transcriptional regulator n=1 Tax=Paracoccus sp. TaxID=267 RepID=UPI002E8C9F32|nr:GntR family transcriptional regulator [Pseudomonadota bacterium]